MRTGSWYRSPALHDAQSHQIEIGSGPLHASEQLRGCLGVVADRLHDTREKFLSANLVAAGRIGRDQRVSEGRTAGVEDQYLHGGSSS